MESGACAPLRPYLSLSWRPADLEQRNGRIIRRGNENPEVEVTTYVTKNTFDAYLYQLVESKQTFIAQVMTSKSPVRSAEDVDESVLSYAEIKALATGNPYIKEKMDLDIAVSRLKLLKSNHLSERYALEDRISKSLPAQISAAKEKIRTLQADIAWLDAQPKPAGDEESKFPGMTLQGMVFEDKKIAGAKLIEICKDKSDPAAAEIGMYRGFALRLSYDVFEKVYVLELCREGSCPVELGDDPLGNLMRIDNALAGLPKKLEAWQNTLAATQEQLAAATEQVKKPFPQEQELAEKLARLSELNRLLDLDKKDHDVLDTEPDERDVCPARCQPERSR